jgi:hypothetical protein
MTDACAGPELVNGAGQSLNTETQGKLYALSDARRRKQTSAEKVSAVYNLTVEGAHCYYANGVLVHNCDTVSQGVRYLREMGLLVRAPERLNEIEESRRYKGPPPAPLYPV